MAARGKPTNASEYLRPIDLALSYASAVIQGNGEE